MMYTSLLMLSFIKRIDMKVPIRNYMGFIWFRIVMYQLIVLNSVSTEKEQIILIEMMGYFT